jgi:hypothetical protein
MSGLPCTQWALNQAESVMLILIEIPVICKFVVSVEELDLIAFSS